MSYVDQRWLIGVPLLMVAVLLFIAGWALEVVDTVRVRRRMRRERRSCRVPGCVVCRTGRLP